MTQGNQETQGNQSSAILGIFLKLRAFLSLVLGACEPFASRLRILIPGLKSDGCHRLGGRVSPSCDLDTLEERKVTYPSLESENDSLPYIP